MDCDRRSGYAFGPYLLDPVRRLLWGEGKLIPISGKAFEVLQVLLENRDRIVEKDELLKRIWPDTFVQENNLVRHICNLRKALGQHRSQHDYILTIQGRGYRFVSEMHEVDSMPPTLRPPEDPEPSPSRAAEATPDVVATAEHAYSGDDPPGPTVVPPRLPRHVPAHESQPRAALFAAIAGAVTTAAAAVVAALVLWNGEGALAGSPETRILRQITYDPSVQRDATVAPDTSAIAFASDRSGNFDIMVKPIVAADAVAITSSPYDDWQPAWSRDGKWLAYRSERDGGGIYVISPQGKNERRVAPFGYRPQWSSKGPIILFSTSEVDRPRPELYLVGLDGTEPRRFRPDIVDQFSTFTAAWHPDGERISVWGRSRKDQWAFVTASLSRDEASPTLIPAQITEKLLSLDLTLRRFTWAPSGQYLYFEGRSHETSNLWRVRLDSAKTRWEALERLTAGPGKDDGISLSSDGRLLAFTSLSDRTRIWALDLDPTTGRVANDGWPVTPGGPGEFDAAVSKDGRKLAYRTIREGRQELWQHSLDDGTDHRLIAEQDRERSSPRWSPDGKSLAYLLRVNSPGAGVVRRVTAIYSEGANSERLLMSASSAGSNFIPDDWSSDSSKIIGTCQIARTERFGLCVTDTLTGRTELLASDPQKSLHSGRFSPNQKWVAFKAIDRLRQLTSTLFLIPATGGTPVPLTEGIYYDDKPRWSADGRSLFFLSNRGGIMNVWRRRVDPVAGSPLGEPIQVTSFTGSRRAIATALDIVEVSVAAQRIFLPVTETSGQIWVLQNVER